ncbi:unnamed protein product [Closterium sp. NIES-65]|nr:unnamed protein product [Closterium sp. NIES-65]
MSSANCSGKNWRASDSVVSGTGRFNPPPVAAGIGAAWRGVGFARRLPSRSSSTNPPDSSVVDSSTTSAINPLLLFRRLVCPAMPVSIGDEYYSYSLQPFVVASTAFAPPAVSSPVLVAAGMSPLPAPRSAPSSVTQAGLVSAPAAPPVPAAESVSAPGVVPDPAHSPAPVPVVPPVPVAELVRTPVLVAASAVAGGTSLPPLDAPAVAPSAAAGVDPACQPPPATSASLSSAEVQSAHASPPDAPAPPTVAATVPPSAVLAGPAPAPLAPGPPAQRPA